MAICLPGLDPRSQTAADLQAIRSPPKQEKIRYKSRAAVEFAVSQGAPLPTEIANEMSAQLSLHHSISTAVGCGDPESLDRWTRR